MITINYITHYSLIKTIPFTGDYGRISITHHESSDYIERIFRLHYREYSITYLSMSDSISQTIQLTLSGECAKQNFFFSPKLIPICFTNQITNKGYEWGWGE
ncbi:hypothetical protein GDO81_021547 [Engystomops pustulosus]|uniref:Uncharacterized protein n=1 Tax=Engystomops pustulosus TaxID=76066 RepID=A0AAV6Z677_ENGPU|nr:hypothetical protein GDO81_021547 [Engystomops pustulosus]